MRPTFPHTSIISSAAALLIFGLPLLAEAMALRGGEGQLAIGRRDTSSIVSSSTTSSSAPTSPSGVENNTPIPWRGWKKQAAKRDLNIASSLEDSFEKRGLLDLLGLGGDEESDGGSSITTTTTTANPSPTGDESGEEMNPGFRGWIKRGEKDKREEADDEGEDEEKNWALRGFKKVLIKRQEGDSTYGEEENMGPYRGYKL